MLTRRPPSFSFALLALAGAAAAGCGPAGLGGGQGFRTLSLGGAERRVVLMTDVDTVRDLAIAPDKIYAATDKGLLVAPREGDPTLARLGRAEGLPNEDVRAVALGPDGAVWVATADGMAIVEQGSINPAVVPPPVGSLADLAVRPDGTVWACGRAGLARYRDGQWLAFGEPLTCTTLALDPEDGALWVGTTEGALRIEGEDIVREHGQSRGIPEAYVAQLAPLPGGRVLALLRGPGRSLVGYWDGVHWYGYTLRDFPPLVSALLPRGDGALLFAQGRAFSVIVGPARGDAVAFVPMAADREHFGVRTYRGRLSPPADARAASAVRAATTGEGPAARGAQPLVEVDPNAPTLEAPPLSIRAETAIAMPEDGYAGAVARDGTLALADRNRGLLEVRPGGEVRFYRTMDLPPAEDLQIASDTQRRTWMLSRRGDLVRLEDDLGLRRVGLPDGLRAEALATGEGGAYLCALVEGTSTVRIFRADGSAWRPVLERTLQTPTRLVGIPFMGVAPDKSFWLALRVEREQGPDAGTRMRGVAVVSEQSEGVLYHHRGANPVETPGATPLPDEVTAIDFTDQGAWFPTLSGAVRVGDSQAVVFGEARGVRGEVVTDVATGTQGRVWVASAEGVGAYQDGRFDFRFPAVVQQARPTALAVDPEGNLWGAGPRGLVYFDGQTWHRLTEENGLPTNELLDVEVDARGRAFLLTREGVLMFVRSGS
jgi:hypothetical protein